MKTAKSKNSDKAKIKQIAAPARHTPKKSRSIVEKAKVAEGARSFDPAPPVPEPDVPKYEPKSYERDARLAWQGRWTPTPHVKVFPIENGQILSLDHPDLEHGQALLMQALATGDQDFYKGLLTQLSYASARPSGQGPHAHEEALNFMLSVIEGIQPKDQLETMLGAQLAAVHMLTMKFAYRLNNLPTNLESLPIHNSAERTLNKLARTFAAQVEALKRYRTGGEQKVTVEHVTVNKGGKAIVGNITQGGVGASEKPETTS